MKSQSENIFYVVFMAVMGFWLRHSLILTNRKATQFDTGVNFFPVVLSAGIIILTAYLLIKNIWTMRVAETEEKTNPFYVDFKSKENLKAIGSFFIVLGLLLLYVILLKPLRFALSTLIFLILMNLVITYLTNGKLHSFKIYSTRLIIFVVFSFGLPLLFKHVFRLMLP